MQYTSKEKAVSIAEAHGDVGLAFMIVVDNVEFNIVVNVKKITLYDANFETHVEEGLYAVRERTNPDISKSVRSFLETPRPIGAPAFGGRALKTRKRQNKPT